MTWTTIFDTAQIEQLEGAALARRRELTDADRSSLLKQYQTEFKDPDTYTSLCYAFGFGLHHLYLRYYGLAAIDLAAGLLFWTSLYFFFTEEAAFGLLSAAVALYNGIDFVLCLVRGDQIVRYHNILLEQSLIARFTHSAP